MINEDLDHEWHSSLKFERSYVYSDRGIVVGGCCFYKLSGSHHQCQVSCLFIGQSGKIPLTILFVCPHMAKF